MIQMLMMIMITRNIVVLTSRDLLHAPSDKEYANCDHNSIMFEDEMAMHIILMMMTVMMMMVTMMKVKMMMVMMLCLC